MWTTPECLEFVTTLYKEGRAHEYEDKEWMVVIEEVNLVVLLYVYCCSDDFAHRVILHVHRSEHFNDVMRELRRAYGRVQNFVKI